MKRNSGIIKDKIRPDSIAAPGIHDLHDQHVYKYDENWPSTNDWVSITPSTTAVSEAVIMTMTIVVIGHANGEDIYYKINTSAGPTMVDADFIGITVQGTAAVTSNQVVLSFHCVPGDGAENNEFEMLIYEDATYSTVKLTSATVVVTDVAGFDATWDLEVASAPTGVTVTSAGGTPAYAWSATYGFQTAGNASGFAYPLSITDSFSGDYLFQASVYFGNNCSDPAIGLWASANGRSWLNWSWGTTNSRGVSFQCNCTSYPMINTPTGGQTGSNMAGVIGSYVTMHIWHYPNDGAGGSTRATITKAKNDWTITGVKYGFTTVRTNSYDFGSTDIYMGLGSDYDGASLGSGSTNFSAIRIRDSNLWVAP